MTLTSLIIAMTLIVLFLVVDWSHDSLRRRIADEKVFGNIKVRDRQTRRVGRATDVLEATMPAETMPGWVWFRWTRHPRQPLTETIGWAPTRRLARRGLAKHRAQVASSGRR